MIRLKRTLSAADLRWYVSNCLAQPSTAEGFGYPPLEAMACGSPAVVSRLPVLMETTGGYAETADPDEPESWLKSFGILDNRAIYREKLRGGLKWVKSFTGPKAFDHHILYIEELIW